MKHTDRILLVVGIIASALGVSACGRTLETAAMSSDPAGAPCTLDAALIESLGLPPGSQFAPDDYVEVTWTLQNTGTCKWPDGTLLVRVSGHVLRHETAPDVLPVPPGVIVAVTLDLVIPQELGSYVADWRLQAPDGTLFGPLLPVSLLIGAPTQDPLTRFDSELATLPPDPPTREPTASFTRGPTSTRQPTQTATLVPAVGRLGDQGPAVVAIQYLLRAEGYDLEADGIFGPITESAVIRFQLAEGLKGDGVFEDETFYALVEKHVLKMGDEGEDVRALQYLLTHRCWSGIAVDGVFGQATYDAVVNVQSIHVFFFHRGVVATETWHAIMRGECDLRMGGSTPR